MAKRLSDEQVVTQEELLMIQIVQIDIVTQLFIEKGVITEEEFFTKLKQVQHEYQNRKAE